MKFISLFEKFYKIKKKKKIYMTFDPTYILKKKIHRLFSSYNLKN